MRQSLTLGFELCHVCLSWARLPILRQAKRNCRNCQRDFARGWAGSGAILCQMGLRKADSGSELLPRQSLLIFELVPVCWGHFAQISSGNFNRFASAVAIFTMSE